MRIRDDLHKERFSKGIFFGMENDLIMIFWTGSWTRNEFIIPFQNAFT